MVSGIVVDGWHGPCGAREQASDDAGAAWGWIMTWVPVVTAALQAGRQQRSAMATGQ